MKKIIFTSFFVFAFWNISNAQDSTKTIDYTPKVSSLDSIVTTLYKVVSGEKGKERDWELFKHLFLKEAKLIPTFKANDTLMQTRYLSPKDYIDNSNNWMLEHGFFKKEIKRKIEGFGNIAHVFSSYYVYKSESDPTPLMRGIDSIQLFFDGTRWWIVNIYWTHETLENPIPSTYLNN